MSALSDYIGDAPIGSVIQAPYNLTDANYLPCLGQKVVRASYPALSACLPSVGTFTPSTRTKAATSSRGPACAAGTNFVLAGATGTNNIQTSPDGATWTLRTTPAATNAASLIYDGTNVVMAQTGGAPCYSADNGGTWAQSVSGPTTFSNFQSAMAWSPSLGTVGRFLCTANSAANISYSDDRGYTWTSVAHGLGCYIVGVCWTGSVWLGTTDSSSKIAVSTTGLAGTWSLVTLPFQLAAAGATSCGIASDGAGKIIILDTANTAVITSTDHGATWQTRKLAGRNGSVLIPDKNPSFVNGRFFVSGVISSSSGVTQTALAVSTDLQAWVVIADQNMLPGGAGGAVAYKSGIYIEGGYQAAACATWVEDTSKMYLPASITGAVDYNYTNATSNTLNWIKAK